MIRKLVVVGVGALLATTLAGCDEETLAKVSPDAAKMFVASQGIPGGDTLMERLQSRDRLQDGTGANCADPAGICDGTGPYGYGGSNGNNSGTGAGGGDRLRDGSCGN